MKCQSFPDITDSNKELHKTVPEIIYNDHLYYQEAKDAVVRNKMGDFPSLKDMTQRAYIENQKESRKKTLVDSGMISGFTSGIKYKDPNNRGTIDTESAIWNKVKNEIFSDATNRNDFNNIQNDIVDDKNNITRTYNNFFRDYQIKYKNLSLPIEQQLESSERENARIQAATYPSRDIVTDGMSTMMKEGMSIIDNEKNKIKNVLRQHVNVNHQIIQIYTSNIHLYIVKLYSHNIYIAGSLFQHIRKNIVRYLVYFFIIVISYGILEYVFLPHRRVINRGR